MRPVRRDSGRVVIELTVNAAGLARSRFAVSPLHELVATLLPWGLQPVPDAPIGVAGIGRPTPRWRRRRSREVRGH
ncbi:hypothetical protein [Streptomyces sp. SCL15-6]|uniref:hypothetical protein n=1 Tax=Streptomyces sp. SCL15-6 TaxID=2967222 RepID=UPI0029669EE5|nr:hypothetical protein [Streptomyces sp. SCL15-6]